MQENVAYMRTKVVGLFPEPYASGSYVHWAALLKSTGLIGMFHQLVKLASVWVVHLYQAEENFT
jgi:hypothetical protein